MNKYLIGIVVVGVAAAYFMIDWETLDYGVLSRGDRDARRMTTDEYKRRMSYGKNKNKKRKRAAWV